VWEIEESGLTFCATLYIIYLPSLVGYPVYDSVPINGAAHCLYQHPDLAFCWLLQPKPVLPLDKVELGFDTPGNLLLATLIIWKTFFDTSFHCSGLCWTVVAPNRDVAVPAEGMATYRHWSVSLWRDPDDVSHCRILSPDKTEWRLISATLCGWGRCFVADQLWLMTRIREEEDCSYMQCAVYCYIPIKILPRM